MSPGGQDVGGAAHLGLSEHQRCGHFEALGPRQVLVEFELVFQLQQLLAGEGRAWPAALPQEVRLRLGCGELGVRLQPGSALQRLFRKSCARCPLAFQSPRSSVPDSDPSLRRGCLSWSREVREPRTRSPGGAWCFGFNGTKSFYLRQGLCVLIEGGISQPCPFHLGGR